jgi:hypothetical protein
MPSFSVGFGGRIPFAAPDYAAPNGAWGIFLLLFLQIRRTYGAESDLRPIQSPCRNLPRRSQTKAGPRRHPHLPGVAPSEGGSSSSSAGDHVRKL